ncbi:MAG: hypothetical protein CLLPBCKN_006267 [Chroococcidiopsis cubana SAG 39.79]|uniref:hypothetical protein n=1 Tax=Chroococcidiopsis cubana TaxID=171392 RepID=UPI000D055314|nr:hypothetical protein [Chroococcidiopsis cubana]MDZ4876832.1 hypothetical protein [Chroococcidiopsis cubana SAG 39.79]PSB60204.1 hypothetical protein C7B79_26625 [Chroococcidiopsis cubana CCALA 043]
MGVRSDDRAGHSYGRVGTTPIVPGTGQRFGVNKLSLVDGGSQLITGNQPDLILIHNITLMSCKTYESEKHVETRICLGCSLFYALVSIYLPEQ